MRNLNDALTVLQAAMDELKEAPFERDRDRLGERVNAALTAAQAALANAATAVFASLAAARAPLPPAATDHADCPVCPWCLEPVGVATDPDGRALPTPVLCCPGCGHRWIASAEDRALAEGADAAWAALVDAGAAGASR